MRNKDRVAVVILNWNGDKMLRRYLPTLLRHTSEEQAAIYIADNGSTDGSMKTVEEMFPRCRRIELDENYGFAEGYNKALRTIDAELYVLLNSDVEVSENWLSPLLDFMDKNPRAAACQPKLLAIDNSWRFEYAGAAGGFIDKWGYPLCRGRIFNKVEYDFGQYEETIETHWASGAAMMIRSRDYWAAGGLDGRFFAHNEEIDLCWRLRIMGRTIHCVPGSVVYHLGGGTLPQGNPQKTFLNFRNNLTMLYKCLPEEDLRKVMRARWWLDRLAALQALVLKFNLGDCRAILRARREFKRWRHDFDADRQQIQASRQLGGSLADRLPFSALWQYYVKGNRQYKKIMSKMA